jgi:hypothetical protein
MFTSFHSDPPTVQIRPTLLSKPRPAEKDIYKTMWSKPEYRTVAPGEHCAMDFSGSGPAQKGRERCLIWGAERAEAVWL